MKTDDVTVLTLDLLRARIRRQGGSEPRVGTLVRWARECEAEARKAIAADRAPLVPDVWTPMEAGTPEPSDWRGDYAAEK